MVKILIVDNHQDYRAALKDSLYESFSSIFVDTAKNGQEAMEKLESFNPSLIIMELRLPDASGFKLTERIKTKHSRMNIITLRNYDLPEYREIATRCGASLYVSKDTLSDQDIFAMVKSLLSHAKKSGPPK